MIDIPELHSYPESELEVLEQLVKRYNVPLNLRYGKLCTRVCLADVVLGRSRFLAHFTIREQMSPSEAINDGAGAGSRC